MDDGQVQFEALADLAERYDARQVGRYVRSERRDIGLTLVDMGALCGVSRQAILNIERGRQKGIASWRTILKVARAIRAARTVAR